MQNSLDLVSLCVRLVLARWWNSKLHCVTSHFHPLGFWTGLNPSNSLNRVLLLKPVKPVAQNGLLNSRCGSAVSGKAICRQMWATKTSGVWFPLQRETPRLCFLPDLTSPVPTLPPDVHLAEGSLSWTAEAQDHFSWVLLGELLENISIKQSSPERD